MKKAPCARLGMRINPKIREKPDDSRKSRPPKATLLSVWMIQNCMGFRDSALDAGSYDAPVGWAKARARWLSACPIPCARAAYRWTLGRGAPLPTLRGCEFFVATI